MMTDISWAQWHYSWLFIFLLCSLVLIAYTVYKNTVRMNTLVVPIRENQLFSRAGLVRRIFKALLYVVGLTCVYIALLQPQWNEKEELVEQQGRDVLIALDVSRSMLAEDIKPNRLSFAKQKIKELVARLNSDRVGLILFAGDAFIHCPLTHDIRAFGQFLDQVDARTISSGTTAFDKALARAIQVYDAMPERKHRLVVAFTDGEDYSKNLASIKAVAQDLGLHVFTVGVGTSQGAPVPILNGEGKNIGHEKEANGQVVMSRLNQEMLQSLAHDVGGVYVQSVPDSDVDIRHIVQQVERFEKEAFDQTRVTSLEEKYYYFIAVSFVCLLGEWLL